MTRHQSIRIDGEIESIITARMLRDNCDESKAIRSLIKDGAGVEQPQPLVAKVATPDDLGLFAALVRVYHRDFLSAKSRLAMALPADPSDKELCALVTKWRATSAELEVRAREIYELAERLAETMTGLSRGDHSTLRQAKSIAVSTTKDAKHALTNPQMSEEDKFLCQMQLSHAQILLRAIELLGL